MNEGPVRPEADDTRVPAALEVLRELFPGAPPDIDPSSPGYEDWLRSLDQPLGRALEGLRALGAWIEPLADADPFVGRFGFAATGADEICGKLLATFEGAAPETTPDVARDLRRTLGELETCLGHDRPDARQTALRALAAFRDAVGFLRDGDAALSAVRELHSSHERPPQRTMASLRDLEFRIERLQERWYDEGRASLDMVIRRIE